jgi:outer membrane protein W
MLGKAVFRQRMVNVRLGTWRVYTGTLPRVTTPTPIIFEVEYDDAFGTLLQAGFDYNINDKWTINLDITKM